MNPIDLIRRPIQDALDESIRVFDAELASDHEFVRDLCARVGAFRGKMLRPTLLLLVGQACGRITRDHVVLAAVIEMVHVATLVHDDILDEADLRRRSPTINRLAGNEAAVLLGDYLISHAYHLCSSIDSQSAARRVSAATNRVCEGELLQIHHRGDLALTEVTYLEIIRGKTAELTRAAGELGARYAGATDSVVADMAAFGEEIGLAFQIVDDVLDLTADDDQTGKSSGRDAEMGKLTLPAIHALGVAGETDANRLRAWLAAPHGDNRAALRDALERLGGTEYAATTARRYIASATQRLEGLPPSDAREALRTAAEFVVQRSM